ncbi:MAG TPA: T9SS type A sorting domain-containing protein [Bacteroidales bacterium]|nr:T9SS type A sorting domain-containing protein [Bacteroidales bacterium]HPS15578.1 T9SS type A sorting domain-containing protein [Bacteroidales bacterium]
MKKILIIFSIVALSYSNYGQIVYHDFNPDIEIQINQMEGDTTKSVLIDVNSDSIYDLKFSLRYWYDFATPQTNYAFSTSAQSINGMKEIAYITPSTYSYCDALALNQLDTIFNQSDWVNSAYLMYTDPAMYTNCNSFGSNKYLAFRLDTSGNINYGWVKASTAIYPGYGQNHSNAILTIKEFAYNSNIGEGLIAGDTLTSLISFIHQINTDEQDIIIKPNPVNDFITVSSFNNYYDNLKLYNMYGQEIITLKNIKNYAKVDCTSLISGTYYLILYNNNKSISKKIIICK